MRPARAWLRLQSSIGLDLLDPDMAAWVDRDLAKGDDHVRHKRADRLAAASEALHVAGWSRRDLVETLGIELVPMMEDPLPRLESLQSGSRRLPDWRRPCSWPSCVS